MSYDVVAFGELIIDFFEMNPSPRGNPVFEAFPGGGAANVLAQVSALGGKAAMIGLVGADYLGNFLLRTLSSAGIDPSAVVQLPGVSTGIGIVHSGKDGEPSFAFYRNAEGERTALADDHLEVLRGSRLFHFTSVSLASAGIRAATLRTVAEARKYGAGLSFDVNFRPTLWQGTREQARQCILSVVPGMDIVKLTEGERDFLFPGSDDDRCLDTLHSCGVSFATVSRGRRGTCFSYAGGRDICPAFPVDAIDTTGCGDAFIGTFLALLARRGGVEALGEIPLETMRALLARASAAGALCALRQGSFTIMPNETEIKAVLERGTANL